jgi:perosamine synthetase
LLNENNIIDHVSGKTSEKRKDYLPFGKPDFSEEEIAAVVSVMKSGWIGMGKEVELFEQELSAFIKVKHVITINSCTSALYLSLLIKGISEGDEVIVPTLTWCSTANAVIYCGAKPVFCDVDEETMSLSIETVLKKVTEKTKAVLVVHFGGLAFNVDELRKKLPQHISIIEDAAHAFGAEYPNGDKVGSSDNLTCFSFYANKNLSTGEGGAICTNDDGIANILRSLIQHGMPVNAWQRYNKASIVINSEPTQLGYKMNYTDLHASIGRVQLKRQTTLQNIRHSIAEKYVYDLGKLQQGLVFQTGLIAPAHAKHLIVVKLPLAERAIKRDDFLMQMRALNIGATVHYRPLHLMAFYANRYGLESLPVSEKLFKQIVTLPISSSMTEADADDVISGVQRIYSA